MQVMKLMIGMSITLICFGGCFLDDSKNNENSATNRVSTNPPTILLKTVGSAPIGDPWELGYSGYDTDNHESHYQYYVNNVLGGITSGSRPSSSIWDIVDIWSNGSTYWRASLDRRWSHTWGKRSEVRQNEDSFFYWTPGSDDRAFKYEWICELNMDAPNMYTKMDAETDGSKSMFIGQVSYKMGNNWPENVSSFNGGNGGYWNLSPGNGLKASFARFTYFSVNDSLKVNNSEHLFLTFDELEEIEDNDEKLKLVMNVVYSEDDNGSVEAKVIVLDQNDSIVSSESAFLYTDKMNIPPGNNYVPYWKGGLYGKGVWTSNSDQYTNRFKNGLVQEYNVVN